MGHSSSHRQPTRAPLCVHRSSRSRRPTPCRPSPKLHRSNCRAGSVLLPSGHGGRLSSSSSQTQRSHHRRRGAIHGCGASSWQHVSLKLARQHAVSQASRQLPCQLRRRKRQLRLPISNTTKTLRWPAQARARRNLMFPLNHPLTLSGWDWRRRHKRLDWTRPLQWSGSHSHRWVWQSYSCMRQHAFSMLHQHAFKSRMGPILSQLQQLCVLSRDLSRQRTAVVCTGSHCQHRLLPRLDPLLRGQHPRHLQRAPLQLQEFNQQMRPMPLLLQGLQRPQPGLRPPMQQHQL
jgi:hypothetical protein